MKKKNEQQPAADDHFVTVVIPNKELDAFPEANTTAMDLAVRVRQDHDLTYVEADVAAVNEIVRILRAFNISFRLVQ
jgi:hypothetical protein